MKNVICVWCNKNSQEFEKQIPLQFVGSRNNALGFCNQIEILFLDGFDRIDELYKSSLKELGYNLHDCSEIFYLLEKKFHALERFGDYEKKCFLRWLVIYQYFAGEAIVHYDGDIVFNEDPLILQNKMQNKTFMVQGCPAISCVSDQDWFNQYQSQLELFIDDIEEYSERAWTQREGWELSEENKWAGSRARKIISSDQDMFSHLIHTDQIIQNNPHEIISQFQSYILFENPICIHLFSPWNKNMPFKYERVNNIDFIQGEQVAFWHMQGYFVKYLGEYINFRNILGFLNITITNDLDIDEFGFNKKGSIYTFRRKIINKFFKRYSRLDIYNLFFNKRDFSDVLNSRVWWKKGVFQ